MTTVSPAALPGAGGGRPLRLSRLSDELLARYAARGSERAFSVLYERYHQPLYGYCRSIVRNEADAQDALQSAFTSAFAALTRDARNAPLRPWLYRIAHNESISLLRRRNRDVQHEVVPEPSVLGSSAEEEAAGRARWRRVVEDLAELPERQRGALLLRELAGLSHEDIAISLGLTVGGAKQAIFEARQGLAEVEEGRAMSCDEVRQRVSEGDGRVLRGRRVRSHLRECAACEAFALAIPARRTELRAYAPALAPAAAATVLSRVMRAASPHGGASATASAATAGAIGKAAGTAIAWKAAVAGVALVATAAAGVTGLTGVLRPTHTSGRPAPQVRIDSAGSASYPAQAAGSASPASAIYLSTSAARAHHSGRGLPGTAAHHAGLALGHGSGVAHSSRGHSVAGARPAAHPVSPVRAHTPAHVRHTRPAPSPRSQTTPHPQSVTTTTTAGHSGATVSVQAPSGATTGVAHSVTSKLQKVVSGATGQ